MEVFFVVAVARFLDSTYLPTFVSSCAEYDSIHSIRVHIIYNSIEFDCEKSMSDTKKNIVDSEKIALSFKN